MLLLKVFACVLLATVTIAEEEDSGQYNPDLYEKPYNNKEEAEDAAVAASTATTEEPAEPAEPAEPTEPEEPSESVESSENPQPEVPPPPVIVPEVIAAAPPVHHLVPSLALPYPLLYAGHNVAPFVYSTPQFLRIAAAFPTVAV